MALPWGSLLGRIVKCGRRIVNYLSFHALTIFALVVDVFIAGWLLYWLSPSRLLD